MEAFTEGVPTRQWVGLLVEWHRALNTRGAISKNQLMALWGGLRLLGQAKGRKGAMPTAVYAFPESTTPQTWVHFRPEGLRTRGLQPAHGNVCGSR